MICFHGKTAEVLNPEVRVINRSLTLTFDCSTLRVALDLVLDRLSSDGTRPVLAPVPAKSDVLPYKNSEGPLVFIASGSEGGTAAVAGSGISDEERDLVLRVGKEPPKERRRPARAKDGAESAAPISLPVLPNPVAADVLPSIETPMIPPLPLAQQSGGKRNESDFKTGDVAKLAMACRNGPQMVMAKRITDGGISKWLITGPVGEWLHTHNRSAMLDDKIDVGDECYSIAE